MVATEGISVLWKVCLERAFSDIVLNVHEYDTCY